VVVLDLCGALLCFECREWREDARDWVSSSTLSAFMPSLSFFFSLAAALRSAVISAFLCRYADLASLKTLTMCLL
jgi:hypothetical protein